MQRKRSSVTCHGRLSRKKRPPKRWCTTEPAGPCPGLLLSRGGEGGRGFWTQNLVYQKWPDQIFPIVNFVFSHYGHFCLGRGGGGFGGGVPPPLVFNYSKEALAHAPNDLRMCWKWPKTVIPLLHSCVHSLGHSTV